MEELLGGRPTREAADDAADLFLWMGLVAAMLGGIVGMATRRPIVVVLSIVSLIGFVAVRWSLARRRSAVGMSVVGIALVSIAFVAWILGGIVGDVGLVWLNLGVLPVLGVLLAFSVGTIAARSLIDRHPSLVVEMEAGRLLDAGLQVSAVLLVVASFALVHLRLGGLGAVTAMTGVVAAYASTAGHLAGEERVPVHVAAGGAVGLVAHAWYLVQFASIDPALVSFGAQGIPLAGMVLSAFPVALGIVALQSEGEGDLDVEEGPTPSEGREHQQT